MALNQLDQWGKMAWVEVSGADLGLSRVRYYIGRIGVRGI